MAHKLMGSVSQYHRPSSLSILLLCDNNRDHANTVLDHIASFVDYSRYDVRLYNPRWVRRSIALDLDEFDVVVIHYSLYLISNHYLSSQFKDKLRRFHGLKIQFIQDDYRRIDEFAEAMRDIGIQVLFTLYPDEQRLRVWDEHRLPGVIKLTTLAGFIPERLVSRVMPMKDRPIDIGYRGRVVPYWLGKFGQEKLWIGQGVLDHVGPYGLKCDIAWSEKDRIYGEEWNRFLVSCKATLGTESGASITDFDGSIETRVKQYLAQRPDASFEEVHREVLHTYEDNVPIKVISPRMFEAIALRTVLVLFPGEYSGILKPWVHYIPLQRDFSNMEEVAKKLRDDEFLRALTDRAYEDIVGSGKYSFSSFINEFDEVVKKYAFPRGKRVKLRYWLACAERRVTLSFFDACRKIAGFLGGRVFVGERVLEGAPGEILVAPKIILKNQPLRIILLRYLTHPKTWPKVRLKTLMKELFLLGILEHAPAGVFNFKEQFSLSVRFDWDEGRVMIKSCPIGERQVTTNHTHHEGIEAGESSAVPWSSIYSALLSALLKGHIRTMIWDHSGISGHLTYKKNRFLWLYICIGDNGVRNFSSLVSIMTSSQ